jgi:hypothetical protein
MELAAPSSSTADVGSRDPVLYTDRAALRLTAGITVVTVGVVMVWTAIFAPHGGWWHLGVADAFSSTAGEVWRDPLLLAMFADFIGISALTLAWVISNEREVPGYRARRLAWAFVFLLLGPSLAFGLFLLLQRRRPRVACGCGRWN